MKYLGDYKEDGAVYFLWSSNDGDGESITRAVDGVVQVYKDAGVGQSVAGVVDTEDFDGLAGIHLCSIDVSADAFYATGADYNVVLAGATIAGKTVNAVLATFSIENRLADATAATQAVIAAYLDTEIAAILAAVDTEIADIKAKTDNLPADPADDSDIDAQLAAIAAYIDTEITAIKNKTDNLPADPADASVIAADIAALAVFVDTEVADIKAKTDNLPPDPADASVIAAATDTIIGYIDTEVAAIVTAVAAIQAKTDNLPALPAAQGANGDTLETLSDQLDSITLTAADIADAVFDEALGAHTGALAKLYQMAEGDVKIDTDVTPWALVICIKDTDTELVRKKLYEPDDTSVTTETQVVGQQLESAP